MMRALATGLSLLLLAPLAGPAAAMSAEDQKEDELGRQVLQRFEGQLHADDRLDYVAQYLLARITRTGLDWEFFVLRDAKSLNAFAAPGGKVVITEEYLGLLGDDELAFVLGHEMIHVEKRHYVQVAKARQNQLLGRLLLTILLDVGAAGQLLMDAADIALASNYSRDLEREADALGFDLAVAAGYDAAGGILALSRLEGLGGSPWLSGLFATHPRLPSRINRLRDQQPAEQEPTRLPLGPPGAGLAAWEYWGRPFRPAVGVPDLALTVEGLVVSDPAPETAVRAALQQERRFRVTVGEEEAPWRLQVWVEAPTDTAPRTVALRAALTRADDGQVEWTMQRFTVTVIEEAAESPDVGRMVPLGDAIGRAIFDGAVELAARLHRYLQGLPEPPPVTPLRPGPQDG